MVGDHCFEEKIGMNMRRILVLLGKELRYSSKNFIFVFAVVIPVVMSLVVTLLFGTLFSGKPKLGINDQGESELTRLLVGSEALLSRQYSTDEELRRAVESGGVDLGLVIPEAFDSSLKEGDQAQLGAYVWGESLLKNRAAIATTLVVLVREMVGQEVPVEILTTSLGDGENIAWEKRIFPFVVFMALILGGSMVPATSMVDEKQHRTLKALVITPTSYGDVLGAKGIFGLLIALLVSILVLLLNQALGNQPFLLIGVLASSSIMAATFGLLLGILIKDINTLFAVIKGLGILLYAPAIVYLFPGIPQWIGKIFPTYYMVGPVIDISQKDAGWSQVSTDVLVLILLIVVLLGIVVMAARRQSDRGV
jgi:ABC-2 type transport system permease protein